MAWPALDTGNIFPISGTNVDRSAKAAWTNPGNVVSDNGSDATCSLSTTGSDYLVCSNFAFTAIPDGSTILGITVRVEASETGTGSSTYKAQLISDTTPTLIGSAKGDTTVTGTTKVVSTNGGITDLWGATATVSSTVVKNSGFGVVIYSDDTANVLSIDYVTMAVEYFPPQAEVHVVTQVAVPVNRQP